MMSCVGLVSIPSGVISGMLRAVPAITLIVFLSCLLLSGSLPSAGRGLKVIQINLSVVEGDRIRDVRIQNPCILPPRPLQKA